MAAYNLRYIYLAVFVCLNIVKAYFPDLILDFDSEILLPVWAMGGTYYVRHDGTVTAANKANATSPASADTSLSIAQHNLCIFKAGDTIYLSSQGGDFSGTTLSPTRSGASDNYITYTNVPGEIPWLDGTGLTSTVNVAAGKHYLNLVNLSFKGTPTQHIAYAGTHIGTLQNPHFTGAPTYGAIKANNPTLTITDLNVSEFASDKIVCWESTTNTNTITGGTVVAALSGRAFQTDVSASIAITGLTATISTNAGNEPGSFFYANTDYAGTFNITNNNITYNLTAGAASDAHIINILKGTRTVNVTGNSIVCDSTGQTQSAIHVVNQPVVNITGNNITYGKTGTSGFVIDVTATTIASSANISSNIITSQQVGGVVVIVGTDTSSAGDNLLDGATIANNTITTPVVTDGLGAHLIECGYNKNCTASRNYLTGGRHGIVIKGNGDEYTSGGVFQNVIAESYHDSMYAKGQKNVPFYNNTIYISLSGMGLNGGMYIGENADSANVAATGILVKNNIFVMHGGRYTVQIRPDCTGTLDNNLYFMLSGESSIYAKVGETVYQGASAWTDWQTAGYDANGVNADPLFRSATDYRLKAGSPAINAGTDVGLTTDFLGKLVRGLPDIGAYEYYGVTGGMLMGLGVGF